MVLQELLKHVLSSLVEHKEGVSISEERVDGRLLFKVVVDERDLGRIIGREGQTIRAIRSLITSVNPGHELVSVDICE